MGDMPRFTVCMTYAVRAEPYWHNKAPPGHVADRHLNHKLKGVEGIYDRHDYFEERKEALDKLALQISNLVNN